jgi:hypothetical protein
VLSSEEPWKPPRFVRLAHSTERGSGSSRPEHIAPSLSLDLGSNLLCLRRGLANPPGFDKLPENDAGCHKGATEDAFG